MNPLEVFISVAGALLTITVGVLSFFGAKALDRLDVLDRRAAELSERLAKIEILGVAEKLDRLTNFMSEIKSRLDVLVDRGERDQRDFKHEGRNP